MNIEIIKSNGKSIRTSKIKEYFDKLINQFLNNIKEQLNIKETDDIIEILNNYLETNTIIIELDDKEFQEFKQYSRRNYYVYSDTCTLLTTGKYTTQWNNPRQLINVLHEKGIKVPIKVNIGTNREGRLCIKITRSIR